MKPSLRVFSLSFLLSSFALVSCGNSPSPAESSSPNPGVSSSEDSPLPSEDELGTRAYLGSGETSFTRFSSRLGYRFETLGEGKASLTLFAGMDGLPSSAKVSSTSLADALKTSDDLAYGYSSLAEVEDILWMGESDFNPSYYLAFSFEDLNEEDWFANLDFSFFANNFEAKAVTFNPYGIKAYLSAENVSITSVDGEFSAYKKDNKIEKAIVPEYACELQGLVAEAKGVVTAVDSSSSYEGAFQDCLNLQQIDLPNTLVSIGENAFRGTPSLRSITLPESLERIGLNAFGDGTDFDEIVYKAKNLASSSTIITNGHLPVLRLSKDVESLPVRFFAEGAEPLKVVYEGTEAEFLKLKTKKNQNNGFFINNVFCSDSKVAHVTFHLQGGEINGKTEDISFEVLSGGFVEDPGFPSRSGYAFEGWFDNPEGEGEKADLESAFASDSDLYAKWRELGPGYSLANPLEARVGESYTFQTGRGYESGYLRLSAPADWKSDFVYVSVDANESEVDKEISPSYASFNGTVSVYNQNGQEIPLASVSDYTNDYDAYPAQRLLGGYAIRLFLQPGDTFLLRCRLNADPSYPAYGKLVVNLTQQESDWFDEALPYDGKSEVALSTTKFLQRQFYSYSSSKEEDLSLSLKISGMYSTSFEVYTKNETGAYELFGSLSGAVSCKKAFHFEANKTYYFVIGGRNPMTSTQSVSFALVAPQAGSVEGVAIPLASEETASVDPRMGDSYYSFSLQETSDCLFCLSGGSDEAAKKIQVYRKGSSEEILLEKTEPKKTDGNYGYGDYGTTFELEGELEAGDYIIKTGYATSGATTYSLSYSTFARGDRFAYPILLSSSEGGLSLKASGNGKYHQFTASSSGSYLLPVPSSFSEIRSLDENENVLAKAFGGESLRLNLTQGQTVRLLCMGEGEASVTLSQNASTADGSSVSKALTLALDEPINLTPYLRSSKTENFYVSFLVEKEGTYRLYPHSKGESSYSLQSLKYQKDGAWTDVDKSFYTSSAGSDPVLNGYTGQSSDFFLTMKLTPGTYLIDLSLPAASQAKGSSKLFFEEVLEGETEETAKTLDLSSSFEVETRKGAQYFTFVAEKEENIRIDLSGDENANFSLRYNYTETNFLGEEQTKTQTLASRVGASDGVEFTAVAGRTYNIVIASSGTGTLKGEVTHPEEVHNGLFPESPYSFSFEERTDDGVTRTVSEFNPKQKANETLYYAFQVPENGTYALYTASLGGSKYKGVDTQFDLYSADGKKKLGAGNDVGTEMKNSLCVYSDDDYLEATLTKGTTYLIRIRKGYEMEGITQVFGYSKLF